MEEIQKMEKELIEKYGFTKTQLDIYFAVFTSITKEQK